MFAILHLSKLAENTFFDTFDWVSAKRSLIFKNKKPLFRGFLWSHLESNQAPTDYESVALTE